MKPRRQIRQLEKMIIDLGTCNSEGGKRSSTVDKQPAYDPHVHDELDKPTISTLGKRDRLVGPSKKADMERDRFTEEGGSRKKRVSGAPSFGYSDRLHF